MSARSEFMKQMAAAQNNAMKRPPSNSTEALIREVEDKVVSIPVKEPEEAGLSAVIDPAPETPVAKITQRKITQPLGRPKKYLGELEVISMKVPKEIKDRARIAAAARRMSFVDYFMTIISEDFDAHYHEYVQN